MVFWKKIDVSRQHTLPALGEQVCMYTKELGYFTASIYTQEDTRGRTLYYYRPDRYSLNRTKGTALRGKTVWWCALERYYGWTRIYVQKKATLPPLDTPVLINYGGSSYFFGTVLPEPQKSGRLKYYIYAGRNVLTIAGTHVEWRLAPEIPVSARYD